MTLIYQFTAWISFHVINFNFLGPIIALYSIVILIFLQGVSKTFSFVTLSSILIMWKNEERRVSSNLGILVRYKLQKNI